MKTITTLDLRKKLGGILNNVSQRKEQVIISVDEYEEKVLKKDREKRLQELAVEMDKWRKKHRKKLFL